MEDIKSIIAKNIADLRQSNNMTQLELAEKLNYSDKTISKWERAESSPDIAILVEIARLFGVTLDYLVQSEHDKAPAEEVVEEKSNVPRFNKRAISNLSESGAWFVAIFAFVLTTMVINKISFQYLYFVYALPVALIIRLVFNSIWFNPRHNYFIISLLMWSILVCIHVTFLYFGINAALIYLLGIAGQIIIILWSYIARPKA